MTMEKEKDLIQRLKRGEKRAFDRIYGLYAFEILNFCRKNLDCEEDAEEVVQDVFVALWNSRSIIRTEVSLKGLLYTSARNRILNRYRSKVTFECRLDDIRESELTKHTSPESRVEYNEFRRRVIAVVMSLPPTQRRIVIMSRYRGLSHAQIVEKTGLSMQTVKNNLSLALKKLWSVLGNDKIMFYVLLLSYFLTFYVSE